MKKTLIIYAHPYSKSFNHAILERVKRVLKSQGKSYDLIDLYADDFDPRYSAAELALFRKGETLDPLVVKYQKMLVKAGSIIVIAPIWWSDLPAILKGFFDKVMKMNFAYTVTPLGVRGLLTHIKSILVISTSTSPTWYLRLACGNAIEKVFLNSVAKQWGIKKRKWINCGRVNLVSDRIRQRFLSKIKSL